MVDETDENFPRKEDLKLIAARYIDLTGFGYECAGIMVHSYRKPKSSPTIIEKILESLFRRTPMTETYRISLWGNGKFLSCTDVIPEVWKYGNFSETPEIFRARILSNLVKVAMKRGTRMDKKKRSLEDLFILQQLQKIKDAKYYTQPIFTPEEWKQRYPHESEADIPTYIPCWRDLDEIIYQKEGHSPYQKMKEEKV